MRMSVYHFDTEAFVPETIFFVSGGEKWSMRTKAVAIMTILMFAMALPLASVPAVLAHHDGSPHHPLLLKAESTIIYDPTVNDNCWLGTVAGDVKGTVAFCETPANYVVGTTEHFFETFTFTTAHGVITGFDNGLYYFGKPPYLFWSSGQVTGATGDWTYLVGYKYFEVGTTSDPNYLPLVGPTTMMFVRG
jgi:hypothetical protein